MPTLLRRIVPGVVCWLLALPIGAADSQEGDYARRALEAVAQDLRDDGLSPESFQLELIGRPVLYPAHAHLHGSNSRSLPNPARFTGHVLDPTGTGLPSANLTLLDADRRLVAQFSTSRDGSFDLAPSPGTAWLRVEAPGFKAMEVLLQTSVPLPKPIRIVLEVGPSAHTVQVSAHLLAGAPGHDWPEAVVAVGVYGAALYVERTYYVTFHLNEPIAHRVHPSTNLRMAFPLDELQRVNKELEELFAVGLDITRGPERFYPYLPTDMHSHGGWGSDDTVWLLPREVASRLSDDELRHLVSLFLDYGAHAMWLSLEDRLPDDWLEDFPEDTSDPHWPRQAAASLTEGILRMKDRLRQESALNPEHMKVVAPYLRKVLGQGLLAKQWNDGHLPDLPRSTELYVGGPGAIYFVRHGGKLQIATFIFSD